MKGTQPSDFNPFSFDKGFGHFPKKYFNDLGGFISGQVAFLFKFLNQLKFVQCFFPQSQYGLVKNYTYLLGENITRLNPESKDDASKDEGSEYEADSSNKGTNL